ncbi:MAG: methionine--tRNA ligase subunit beta, partial [Acidobacteria bacterium]|nr:methionine--tRNA ligase subunit beta [Acidobacteriota bacterium]
PWTMAGDEAQRPRLATILHTCAEVVRIVTVLLAPVLPASCVKVWKQLGQQEALNLQRLDRLQWSRELSGNKLGEITAVFPRLDRKSLLDSLFGSGSGGQKKSADNQGKKKPPAVREQAPGSTRSSARSSAGGNTITIEDFVKVDLRVGQVVEAEKVKGADRLLRLTVDMGRETRQIVAGIAQAYPAESLVGKKIIVVANLQPRKLRGLESNGMLLAASVGEEDRPVLATFLEEVPNGARLK